jgi:hypothetical protein
MDNKTNNEAVLKIFREKFCFKNYDGKQHYMSLHTNKDQTQELEQFLISELNRRDREIAEENIHDIKWARSYIKSLHGSITSGFYSKGKVLKELQHIEGVLTKGLNNIESKYLSKEEEKNE